MARKPIWLTEQDIDIIASALEYRGRVDHTVSATLHMGMAGELRNPPLQPLTPHEHHYQHAPLTDGNNVLYCTQCADIVPLTKRGHAVTDNPA